MSIGQCRESEEDGMKIATAGIWRECTAQRVIVLIVAASLAVFAFWDRAEEAFYPKVETGTMRFVPDTRDMYTFVLPQALGEFCSVVSSDTEALAALRDAKNSAQELFSLFAYREDENGERVLALSVPVMKLLSAEIAFIISDEQEPLPPRKVGDAALLHCLSGGFAKAFSAKEYDI